MRMSTPSLHRLARWYGVQTAYYDVAHRRQPPASTESLLAVLRSLGAPVASFQDLPAALRERRQALWRRPLEPVAVAWDGGPFAMDVRLPASMADTHLAAHLILETGERRTWTWHGANMPTQEAAEVEGYRYLTKQLPLPGGLPWGYHQLILEATTEPVQALVIAAPLRAYTPTTQKGWKTWGVFAPLYALHSQRGWGAGDLSDLEALTAWVLETGGGVVATLPLLAAFLDEPFEPSPYMPVSRLFWNEFYLDITSLPEVQKCPSAQARLASSAFQKELEAQRHLPLVDYRRQMALKRTVLMEAAQCFFQKAGESPQRHESFQGFLQQHPPVRDYARFRATIEKRRVSWKSWPQPLRDGVLQDGDYDEEAYRYHLYAQWVAHQQLQTLSEGAQQKGPGLYLDLPLGVHPDGYDAWREQALFVQDTSVGAPPDTFFTRGQDWGFPPLHPERVREQGYAYYIACIRNHLRHAGILRIDHVMGLHRLFWVPNGMAARQGVYVRYQAEELYAILSLESHRHRAMIVGEDLGTVPREVRSSMARHGLHEMYVAQYELKADPERALRPVPTRAVASLNTHDMPPFAAFWRGMDIADRHELRLVEGEGVRQEVEQRQAIKEALARFLSRRNPTPGLIRGPRGVLRSTLAFLGRSPARVLLVGLEDLWLETQPQNVPGTQEERPNWRRKLRYSLEELRKAPRVVDMLRQVDMVRKQKRPRTTRE